MSLQSSSTDRDETPGDDDTSSLTYSAAPSRLQRVSFLIGSEQYGADSVAVREIRNWTAINRLPDRPDMSAASPAFAASSSISSIYDACSGLVEPRPHPSPSSSSSKSPRARSVSSPIVCSTSFQWTAPNFNPLQNFAIAQSTANISPLSS